MVTEHAVTNWTSSLTLNKGTSLGVEAGDCVIDEHLDLLHRADDQAGGIVAAQAGGHHHVPRQGGAVRREVFQPQALFPHQGEVPPGDAGAFEPDEAAPGPDGLRGLHGHRARGDQLDLFPDAEQVDFPEGQR
mgnify:CR=1 FL=1